MPLLLLAVVVVTLLLLFRWLAQDREDAVDEGRVLVVPDEYDSLGEAIRAACSGDTVQVRPGTYSENVDFSGKDIRVISENPGDPETVRRTVIDASRQGPAVFFGQKETRRASLEGFTVTGGIGCLAVRWNVLGDVARAGGGIFIGNGANPTLRNNIISGNAADLGGGIYVCASSAALIEDSEIRSNSAVLGGGLRVARDFPRSEDASSHGEGSLIATVRNCRFIANRAAIGGGASISRGVSPDLSENVFCGNRARWDGGGMAIWDHSSPGVRDSEFCDNRVGSDYGFGAGISIMNNCTPRIHSNQFVGNAAEGRIRSGGGAIAIYRSSPTLIRNTATENRAGLGCNLYLWGGSRPEMQANEIPESTIFVRFSKIARRPGRGGR